MCSRNIALVVAFLKHHYSVLTGLARPLADGSTEPKSCDWREFMSQLGDSN